MVIHSYFFNFLLFLGVFFTSFLVHVMESLDSNFVLLWYLGVLIPL